MDELFIRNKKKRVYYLNERKGHKCHDECDNKNANEKHELFFSKQTHTGNDKETVTILKQRNFHEHNHKSRINRILKIIKMIIYCQRIIFDFDWVALIWMERI